MISFFNLYWLFARIGLFTFGGGYAMIPLFQDELVTKNAYLTAEEFANMVALAQMTPGPVGLNAATYVGYHQLGFWGAMAGTLGVMTPSLILVTATAMFIARFKDSFLLKSILSGIRPATLGLIAAAVIFFAETSVLTGPLSNLWKGLSLGVSWKASLIFAAALFAERKYKPNVIWILLGAVVFAIGLHWIG